MSRYPTMPKFRHFCAPCDTCGSTGVVNAPGGLTRDGDETDEPEECPTCEGQSTPCDCEARYEAEGDRRYDQWKDKQD